MIKTFRGLLADGGQNRIRLSTIKGKVGYKIVKLQIMPYAPGASSYENIVKIYNLEQSSIDGIVDFTDSDLLGASFIEGNASNQYPDAIQVIFDNKIFNQDIYITNHDADTGAQVNYYLVLEVIPLDDKGAEYMTIKDLRTRGF